VAPAVAAVAGAQDAELAGPAAAALAVADAADAVAAGAVAVGAMPSGSVISRPPAAGPGEGAACAKSHDLTAQARSRPRYARLNCGSYV